MDWVYKRLKELKIRPQKKMGQNFLINEALAYHMVQSLRELKPHKIVEVGPGLGSLTELLIPLEIPLVLIEVDPIFCKYWKERKCDLVQKDALRMTLTERCSLIGSLPFQIASSLIVKASIEWNIENMVVMIQKEVGDRILSSTHKKDYGFLSVISQCVWDVKHSADVEKDDFFPSPKVKGQILVFYKRNHIPVDIDQFSKFVKICFHQKRKFLKKKLFQFYDRQKIENIFEQMNLPSSLRAEELSPQEYLQFFKFQLKT